MVVRQLEKKSMVSSGDSAVQWGLELFDYFKALAKPISLEYAAPDNFL
jgi:predicted transcriptional regulator